MPPLSLAIAQSALRSLRRDTLQLLRILDASLARVEESAIRVVDVSGLPVPTRAELVARRTALRLSQSVLARTANVSRGMLSDLESGRRSSPALRALVGEVLRQLEASQ